MNVLIVKTSSLGDVIHTLPAITDAARAMPELNFDWVIEQGFAEIPSWHQSVVRVIPLAWRRWRKVLLKTWLNGVFKKFHQELSSQTYDRIIDAQGLLKSGIIASLSKGLRYGLDFRSAREPLATFFYQHRLAVDPHQHAVTRMRQLFALALDYPLPAAAPDYGIRTHFSQQTTTPRNQILFFHGTTAVGKEWPESHWRALAKECVAQGLQILLPWGNEAEKQRAQRIATAVTQVQVLPKMTLRALAELLLQVRCAVAVDTGLGHLAAALNVPTVSLYGPTDPKLIGTWGQGQTHLRAPEGASNIRHMADLLPEIVWERLSDIHLQNGNTSC